MVSHTQNVLVSNICFHGQSLSTATLCLQMPAGLFDKDKKQCDDKIKRTCSVVLINTLSQLSFTSGIFADTRQIS